MPNTKIGVLIFGLDRIKSTHLFQNPYNIFMAEKDQLVLTAIGPDGIGLVERIADFISKHHCNIEDSKMAAFCGQFAVIILISGDAHNLSQIAGICREMESGTGLSITTKALAPEKPEEAFIFYKLTATCLDHPGIVHKISSVLSRFGVNIEAMETKTYSAPMSGTPLFELDAQLAVPTQVKINQLEESLAAVQWKENIDITITVRNPTPSD